MDNDPNLGLESLSFMRLDYVSFRSLKLYGYWYRSNHNGNVQNTGYKSISCSES